jgi:hypothetical protein
VPRTDLSTCNKIRSQKPNVVASTPGEGAKIAFLAPQHWSSVLTRQ